MENSDNGHTIALYSGVLIFFLLCPTPFFVTLKIVFAFPATTGQIFSCSSPL